VSQLHTAPPADIDMEGFVHDRVRRIVDLYLKDEVRDAMAPSMCGQAGSGLTGLRSSLCKSCISIQV
jgi:hypothetical protein